MHAQRGECLAKIWLHPEQKISENFGFPPNDLRVILEQVEQNAEMIERIWHEYFGQDFAF